jgi:hypothetical protein
MSYSILLVAQMALGVIIGGLALSFLVASAYCFVFSPLRWIWPVFLTLGLAIMTIVGGVVMFYAIHPI